MNADTAPAPIVPITGEALTARATAVREEVALLGFAPLIADIRGAWEDGSDAKQVVIDRLMAQHRLSSGELAVIGDGRAEIEYARAAGGLG